MSLEGAISDFVTLKASIDALTPGAAQETVVASLARLYDLQKTVKTALKAAQTASLADPQGHVTVAELEGLLGEMDTVAATLDDFLVAKEKPAVAPVDSWSSWGALEIDPNEVRFDDQRDFLGKGSFGRVYAGRCRGKEVAVKVPVKQQLSEKDLTAFRHEVLMMSKIFHPNVCLFMGACFPANHAVSSNRGFLQLHELVQLIQIVDGRVVDWKGITFASVVGSTEIGSTEIGSTESHASKIDAKERTNIVFDTPTALIVKMESEWVDFLFERGGGVSMTAQHQAMVCTDGRFVKMDAQDVVAPCVMQGADGKNVVVTRAVRYTTPLPRLSWCVSMPAGTVVVRATTKNGPHVATVQGNCTSPGSFLIVSELLHTDMERLLRSDHVLSFEKRIRMAKDAALGVNWLHGISSIIHRDLKPANLLVDSNLTVKLTDFGFAQLRPEREDDTLEDGRGGAKGTPLWMAPEIMMGKPFQETVDVYSFGIILWQILTRQEPFSHHRNLKLFRIAVCKRGERPPMPPDAPTRLRELIEQCWDGEASCRPAFKSIVRRLDHVLLDAVIDDELGAAFWRRHFSRGELRTSVPWNEFAYTLLSAVRAETASEEPIDADAAVPAEVAAAARDLHFFKDLLATKETQTGKGDAMVVTMQRFNTNIKWFGRFFERGAQPLLDDVLLLQTKPWFHGDITKEVAEARLSCRMDGTFLVRLSATTPGCPYTISMINNQHRRILHEARGAPFFVKGSTNGYPTLEDLVEHCKELTLVIACDKSVLGWGYSESQN